MNAASVRALREEGRHEHARELALALLASAPQDAELLYETACVHDVLGREAEAVPYYLACLAGELAPEQRRGAFLGLGSTYRALGRYAEAEHTLLAGLAEFPDATEMKVFLAMVHHNLGRSKEAVSSVLTLLAESSGDPAIAMYRRAILLYARDLDRIG